VKKPTEVPESAAGDPILICFRKIPEKFWNFAGKKIKFKKKAQRKKIKKF
jgi:hypothetical protein